jgi:hypothetical protein
MTRWREMVVLSSAGFGTVHVMGRNNSLVPLDRQHRTHPWQLDGVKNRTDADLRLIDQTFDRPPRTTSEPWSCSCRPRCSIQRCPIPQFSDYSGFQPIAQRIVERFGEIGQTRSTCSTAQPCL